MGLNPGAPRDPREIEAALWDGVGGELGMDVGANMGQSVAIMKERFEQVLAFEPAAESFAVLKETWGTTPRVKIFNTAISDHDGTLTLAIRAAPIQTGQLTAVDMPYLGERQGEPGQANWGQEIGTRQLPCESLDSVVETWGVPNFVKVDTEGHEGQVLDGAPRLLATGVPSWLIEFHTEPLHDHCVAVLEAAGYLVTTVRHPHYPEGSNMWLSHGWIKAV